MKRYPLEPLARACRIDLGQDGRQPDDLQHGLTELRTRIDDAGKPLTLRTMQRWLRAGIDATLADWLACHIAHRHPTSIWPDWDDDGEIEGIAHSA